MTKIKRDVDIEEEEAQQIPDDEDEFNEDMDDVDENLMHDPEDFMNFNPAENTTKLF